MAAGLRERDHVARLLVSCPDRHGIVAAISGFLSDAGANITASDQHSTDPEGGTFYLRMEFHMDELQARRAELERSFAAIAEGFEMQWRLALASERKRVAVLA